MYLMRSALAGIVTIVLTLPLLRAANVPRPAPELEFQLPGGKLARLSQWRGKAIALEFLLTTCSHCQRASQTMSRMQAEFGAKGFQALGVAINDENGSLTAEYARQFQIKYPVGWVKHQMAVDFLQHPVMVSMMMPQLVFIDRKGVIRAQYPGTDPFFQNEEAGMRKEILSLLKGGGDSRATAPRKTSPLKSK